MISICIPIYNFDVTELTESLIEQANRIGYPIEILLFDDHSNIYYRNINSKLNSRKDVNYLEFDFNIGRSKIRNRLADFASGQWLLYFDCDVVIDDPNFLQKYVDSLKKAPVICGGRKYAAKPIREELHLHWKYGVKRECKPAMIRQLSPYNAFISGNFLIERDTYHRIRFNEELSGYGHEDTLFGLDLKRLKVPILHIDNPTVHLGLDTCHNFLAKSEQGVINLTRMLHIVPEMRKDIEKSVKILRVFRIFRFFYLTFFLRWFFRVVNPYIKLRLCSKRPSLMLFDMYKLALLAKLYNKGWKKSESKFF